MVVRPGDSWAPGDGTVIALDSSKVSALGTWALTQEPLLPCSVSVLAPFVTTTDSPKVGTVCLVAVKANMPRPLPAPGGGVAGVRPCSSAALAEPAVSWPSGAGPTTSNSVEPPRRSSGADSAWSTTLPGTGSGER